jgi:hypothetical protein
MTSRQKDKHFTSRYKSTGVPKETNRPIERIHISIFGRDCYESPGET